MSRFLLMTSHSLIAIHQYDEDDTSEQEKVKSPFGSAFRTFDATDYSSIATVDVKKNIFDLCTDSSDCYLAVIEVSSMMSACA